MIASSLREYFLDIVSSSTKNSLGYILKDKSMNMNYASYHTSIVNRHRIQLIGLPDSQIFIEANGPIKPFDIKDRKALDALHAALESGACRWSKMSSEEVKEHEEWMQMQVPKARATRSDKGTKRGRRKQTTDADNDDGENQAPPPKRQRQTVKNPTAAQKARVAKRLPPKPPSAEFLDSDVDDDGSDSEGGTSA